MKLNVSLSKQLLLIISAVTLSSCTQQSEQKKALSQKPEYFMLHPDLEKTYGFTEAVKVGDIVKIMGVVSIDDKGMVVGKGDFSKQMVQCYKDIEKILKHYNCTFDDVFVENYFTTNMNDLHKNAVVFRKKFYHKNYPTGTWIGVKELGSPDMMIEIEVEAQIPTK